MIQYELFLKEISNFLRSCTIKNNYFAQIIAKKVMEKYGLSDLPDHFNPYYLRMCGLSTLDIVIPTYLYDANGIRTINEDYKYRRITDTDPDLTHLIMVRLDKGELDADGEVRPVPSKDKITVGIDTIKENLGPLYLKYANYTNSDGSPYTGKSEIWIIKDAKSKVTALKNRMANFIPDDDGIVVNIITGDLNWQDFVDSCEVFSFGTTIKNRSLVPQAEYIEGDILNVTSEQCSYIRTADGSWVRLTLDRMFDITLEFYAEVYNNRSIDGNSVRDVTTFVRSNALPYVEALVVIGGKNLDWDGMYSAGYEIFDAIDSTIHNDTVSGPLIDIEFDKINSYLGYSESKNPQAGSRINFIRNARAWEAVNSNGEIKIVYTKSEHPQENDYVYTDPNFQHHLRENGHDIRVAATDGNTTLFMFTNDAANTEYRRDEAVIRDHDIALKHCTYEFNGIDWIEVPLRKLFDEEWALQFKANFAQYPKLSYTSMNDPFDIESFDEKLILDDNNNLVIDRYTYLGWDKPVYVPTYDRENDLTKDFTLYTRFSNHMRDEHVKTALKYHIGSAVYNDACEKYPEYIDYIKGVCYPAYRTGRDLASKSSRLRYWYITGDNGMPVKVANKIDYENYITNIELAINEIASDPNFSLEKYDSTLLEENEADSLIDCLKKTLKCVRERWDIGEFGYEELYYGAVWATVWSHLPYLLLVQRILNLRTEAVHVDHIWEYLEGKGLKDYRTVMDNEQQVFLYKNIDYLRGNEGKQSTLKILVDKLLSKFSATVRTKSVLLDTTHMGDNQASESDAALANGTFNINGMYDSVSGDIKILSEDLEEQTSVINDVDGRIEDYDDVYSREYKSGLIPKLGDTLAEQKQRIAESHDAIEIQKHTYAPTKLAEITQGSVTSDTARLAMAFIFQTLVRKLSSKTEISNGCVINAIFHGLSSPKTFTIGECIALVFYAIRKQAWYTFKNKYGEQNFHRNDLWKGLVGIDGEPISVGDRNQLISSLSNYEDCPKYNDPQAEVDCNHEFYIRNEIFNDTIPTKTDIWLPYLGNYTKFDTDETVEISIPRSVSGLDSLINNPTIVISEKSLLREGCYKELMQILSPYEYSSLELKSWNDMCEAEEAGTTPPKYDVCLGGYRNESHVFEKVIGTTALGGVADGTLVGGIVTGSSRSSSDKWYIEAIPDVSTIITSHDQLIKSLSDQANIMLDHYQLTRSVSDAFFNTAMTTLYKAITITDKIKLDLVPGYTTYSEWFESDIELKSVFRTIEEGADQASIYGSIVDNLVSALFPSDKIVISGSVDQTKYAAMKELFQWLGSYNIAYLNTSSVQYETLFLHPVTINVTHPTGINPRPWLCNYDKHWSSNNCWEENCTCGTYSIMERWSTSSFNPGLHKHYWPVIASGWSLSSNLVKESAKMFEKDPIEKGSSCISLNGMTTEKTLELLYGSSDDALEIPVYKESDIRASENKLDKSGITRSNMYYNHKFSWTSISDPTSEEESWQTTANFREGTKAYLVEDENNVGTDCDEATAILLYGSVENAQSLPHFKVAYQTFNQQ